MNPHMEALGFTLVHFCWQAALIAAAYKLAEMAWPGLKPQARYTVGLAALLAMTLAAVATFAYEEIRLFQPAPAIATAAAPVAVGENPAFSLSNWLPWLDAVWLIGVIALTFRMITSLYQVHGLKKHAQPAPIAVQDLFSAALRRFGLTGKVQVRLHPAISGPFVVGAFRAVVYLPLSAVTALSPAQLDAVLSHELEHIRRADYLWNLVQNLIETLFFYHPAVWWIGAKLREQRELCCDDAAIHTCEDPITYATALLNLEEQRRGTPGNLAMALNGQGRHELLSRISRILGEAPDSRLKVRPVAFVLMPALLLTLTAFAAAPATKTATLALAGLQEAVKSKPAADKEVIAPAEITVPDEKLEWDSQSDADTIDPDAVAAEARADALRMDDAKNVDIDPKALAAQARADAIMANADMEHQGIAHRIDPDAIAAQVLAETQRAKADAARVAMASIDPDAIAAEARAAATAAKADAARIAMASIDPNAIAAEARAAAVAAKAQYKSQYKDYQAQKEFYKAQRKAYKADLKSLPPLSSFPLVPSVETPAPLADPAAPVPPAAPLAPLAAVFADWHIETRTDSKGKGNTLAIVTLDKLPNATAMAIPSPDPRTDVQINIHSRVKVLADPQVRVTVDTER